MVQQIVMPNKGKKERIIILFDNGRRFMLFANGRLEELRLAEKFNRKWKLLREGE